MTAPHVEGPLVCTKADLPEVIALVDNAMRQGSDQTMLTDYPLVYRDENLANIRIIKVDGRVVSVVPFIPRSVDIAGCRFTIGIISPTATAPAHQHKGYGLRCLRSSIEGMQRLDIELSVLWTLVQTFPFYEHGDYQAVRSQGWTYRCRAQDAALFQDHDEEMIAYDPATRRYLDDIQAMHEQEVYGIHRTADEYAALFALPKMQTWLARRGGAPVAYLTVSLATNKPGLIEAGGDAAAVETLVHRALARLPSDGHMLAHGHLTPSVLGDLLERKMPERKEPGGGHMMVRLNDVPGFLRKIGPWLKRRNGGQERHFSIGVSDSGEVVAFRFTQTGLHLSSDKLTPHIEMTRRELTSVIFGAHPERPVATPEPLRALFPFYFPIWVLDRS